MPTEWANKTPTETGFYYWKCNAMKPRHVIVVQISKFKYPEVEGEFHAGMLLPKYGGYYNYNYDGPLDEFEPINGFWWGPLPIPKPDK